MENSDDAGLRRGPWNRRKHLYLYLAVALFAAAIYLVLETVLAKFVLHERIGARSAACALAVLAGVVLVGG